MTRLFAFLLVLVPVFLAVYGVTMIRNALFGIQVGPFSSLGWQVFVGILLFLAGLGLMAGFIYHRDKKRKKVVNRLRKRKRIG